MAIVFRPEVTSPQAAAPTNTNKPKVTKKTSAGKPPKPAKAAPTSPDDQPTPGEKRPGRPPSGKIPVSIRLDKDVVEALKATGKGWQSAANAILARHFGIVDIQN